MADKEKLDEIFKLVEKFSQGVEKSVKDGSRGSINVAATEFQAKVRSIMGEGKSKKKKDK